MTIDRIDRTVVVKELLAGPRADHAAVNRRGSVGLGLAVASMRTVVMVVLASLAILVVLPAALAGGRGMARVRPARAERSRVPR